MKHYIEMTLLPGPEIPLHFLWKKAYQQIHLAFVEFKNENNKIDFGVSFPFYNFERGALGNKLRVFSPDKAALIGDLSCEKKLDRLSDYIHITSIRDVPGKIKGYASYQRVQPKSNNERLARRKARRESISYDEAISKIGARKEMYSTAPFIQMNSLSNDHNFPLIIYKQVKESANFGQFSTYGLSSVSTVPEF